MEVEHEMIFSVNNLIIPEFQLEKQQQWSIYLTK